MTVPTNNIARERAKAQGASTYVGYPCKHGHDPIRYVGTGACVECQRQARKEYKPSSSYKKKPEVWRISKDWTPTLANDKDAC